jgi:AraC-like DNA-binding protein
MSLRRETRDTDRVAIDFAEVGIPEVVMLGRYNYNHAHPPLKSHFHRNIFEVCLLERGVQTYIVDAACYNLTGGDLFITKPGEIHGTGLDPESKGRLYWLEILQVPKGDAFLGLTPRESHELMRRFLALPTHHFRNGDFLVSTFERILAAHADTQNPLRLAEVRNLLLRLVLDVIAIAERQIAHPYSPVIQKVVCHIEQTPNALPCITELARMACMSESYFKVLFKRETGMPPVEYAMRRRIERAKDLLRSSNTPITRLAMDLGFSTSQHFSTVFMRLTGLTPNIFRHRAHIQIMSQSPLDGAGPTFHPASND